MAEGSAEAASAARQGRLESALLVSLRLAVQNRGLGVGNERRLYGEMSLSIPPLNN